MGYTAFYHRRASVYQTGRAGRPGWKRGVTLVELLIVLVIVSLVAAAVFSLLQASMRNEARQQDIMNQSSNLRAAMYAVGRDIRMAGSGLELLGSPAVAVYVEPAAADAVIQDGSGWFRYTGFSDAGVRAVMNHDSGSGSGSDMLTIFRTENEASGPLGFLAAPFTPNSSTALNLRDSVTEGETISDGDLVAIVGAGQALIVQINGLGEGATAAALPLGNRFRPNAALPGTAEFPADSLVYNLRDIVFVTYYVDTDNHRLMANYHDADDIDADADDAARPHLVTVAENIEDFQVRFLVSPPNATELEPTPYSSISEENLKDGYTVQAVEMAMVSRSERRSEVAPDLDSVEVQGHTADSDVGYTRLVMGEVVTLRNH